jgi:hypothetical protein
MEWSWWLAGEIFARPIFQNSKSQAQTGRDLHEYDLIPFFDI